MYLRYPERSWETSESVDLQTSPRRRRAEGPRPGVKRSQVAPPKELPTVNLLGVELHAITERACAEHILDELNNGRGGVVVTPNLDHLRRCRNDVNFEAMVAEADLVVADGMPLVWASWLQGTPLPERVAGSSLISTLSTAASTQKRSIFLLGGAPGTAERAKCVLMERNPQLKVVGWHTPPIGFEQDPRKMAAIIAEVSTAKPDIVFVALGSPKQERLIGRLRPILPNSWWLGVGVSFSFLCGDVKRAPVWMQRAGLEWLHRLAQEPRRLFKRYIASGIPFAIHLLSRCLANGISRRASNIIGKRLLKGKNVAAPLPTIAAMSVAPHVDPLDVSESAAELSADIAVHSPQAALLPPGHLPLGIPAPLESQLARAAWPVSSGESEKTDDAAPLTRLRAMILLGGAVRANTLSSVTGRSVLDLPLDVDGSILNFWLSQAAEVAKQAGMERLPVRIMVNQNSREPRSADSRYLGAYRVERDLSEYRGTGGVLRDISNTYLDDDLILVANAAQILLDPLPLVVTTLLRKRGDVSIISHEDGTPSGVMLVTCKTLRLLPTQGFVDMKEQGLPMIAAKYDVRVVRRRRPTGLPVRSMEGYIQALHYYHRRRSGKPIVTDPLAEDWSPSFSLVEPGASVDGSARVHDSVVLAGGVVEPGAVLVRSVVCPGNTVRRDRIAVDQLIGLDLGARRGRPRSAAVVEASEAP